MQHISQPDAVEALETSGKTGEEIGLAKVRVEPRKTSRGAIETILVDVEQDEAVELGAVGAVKEEAGTDPRLKMIGGKIGTVQLEQPPRRATPSDMVRQPVHHEVVEIEHRGRVDRVRFRDRIRVG